jgi:hypothetical protein
MLLMETAMVPIAGDSPSSKFPPPDGESSQILLIPTGTASCDHAQGDGLSARFRPKSHFLCSNSQLPVNVAYNLLFVCPTSENCTAVLKFQRLHGFIVQKCALWKCM